MLVKSHRYDPAFVRENMMGPNSLKIIAELAESLTLEKGMRVLDLGCGRGLTSIFLAQEYGVEVFATDLWIGATDNFKRFKTMRVADKIIPIHAEAHELPFANEFFDVAVSVDAYHYFGVEPDYLPKYLAPLVKEGGQIAIAVPGLKEEFIHGVPTELVPYWVDDMNFHSCAWWTKLWRTSNMVNIKDCQELLCFQAAWRDWLTCDNEYARRDIEMMKAEAGKYFNLVAITATKI